MQGESCTSNTQMKRGICFFSMGHKVIWPLVQNKKQITDPGKALKFGDVRDQKTRFNNAHCGIPESIFQDCCSHTKVSQFPGNFSLSLSI